MSLHLLRLDTQRTIINRVFARCRHGNCTLRLLGGENEIREVLQ